MAWEVSGASFGDEVSERLGFVRGAVSDLLRLDPSRPSTTLQAQPGLWVGPFHWQNVQTASGTERARKLRVNEMLRLMSFPDDFKTAGRADVQRELGNAVPLELGKAVIRALMDQLGYLDGQPTARAAVIA